MTENLEIPSDAELAMLRQSVDRYRRMISEIQDYAIIQLDKDGVIRDWNRGAEKIKQYTAAEILGKHFSIFYLPEDQASGLPKRLIEAARETGRAAQEGWRKRKDGTRFWGSITITAIHDPDGNILGFSKITRDLTERKLAEEIELVSSRELVIRNEALQESEERYHQMVAEVRDYAIILLDVHGNIQNWNTGAQMIKGYSSEIIGSNFSVFYTNEDLKSNLPQRLLAIASAEGRAIQEGYRVRKDGTVFWGSIVITALHNKEGRLIGFSKVTRDLTDKKKDEDRLLAYASTLKLQNEELEQFAYVASHDLQEPLRKIQTFSDVIRKNFGNEELMNRYFDKIDSASRRMSELIKSVLNYSRLVKDEAVFETVDLNLILDNIKTDLELILEEKNVHITIEPLPTVNGNPLQLTQLFSNLISNAIKFSRENPEISITVESVDRNEIRELEEKYGAERYWKVAVADNGIGFEQQYANLIFSMFQRLHGKQEYAGTGIGLALCKKIVGNHQGFIIAHGEPGKGATFNVYLPQAR